MKGSCNVDCWKKKNSPETCDQPRTSTEPVWNSLKMLFPECQSHSILLPLGPGPGPGPGPGTQARPKWE